MTLGEQIKLLRNQAELTQPELAVSAGIEQSYLSKLENDKASPSFEIISKIASALKTDAYAIINALAPEYVQTKLCHIPEVAAQHAQYRRKQQKANNIRYWLASLLIVLGVCTVLIGGTKALFPEVAYNYYSIGKVLPGEPIDLYENSRLGETDEEESLRWKDLLNRREKRNIVSYEYRGLSFVEDYGNHRRFYKKASKNTELARRENAWLIVFGMGFITLGGFMFAFNKPFARKKLATEARQA